MNIWMVMAVFCWAIASMVFAAICVRGTKRAWKAFLWIASALFLTGWAGAYVKYRSSAVEAFRNASPDGKYVVVVYRLPGFGAFEEGTAIGRLFDASGRKLRQGDIPFVGAADVSWYDKEVWVGEHQWPLD